MKPLHVVASPLSADVLRIALARRGLPPDLLTFQLPPAYPEANTLKERASGERDDLEPIAVCLQPGGLRAFKEMGLDVDALAAQGTVITAMRVLHPRGHRVIRLDLSFLSATYPMLVITTPLLRTFLATAARAHGAERSPAVSTAPAAQERSSGAWTLWRYPGILLRLLKGTLRHPQEPLLWDHECAYVCVGQLPGQHLIMSAMPTRTIPVTHQRDTCRTMLDDVTKQLDGTFYALGDLVDEQWFPLIDIGSRSVWDGRALWWGSTSLRLSPLVGMSISYWAMRANRLADELARTGRLSDRFLQQLEADNRRMVQRSLLSLRFHLRPTWVRNAGYWPCLWLLCRSDVLKRGFVRHLWLR